MGHSPAISMMKILLLLVAIVAAEARRFTPGAAIQWKPHIIGGSDASDGQFPHQLSLEYNSPLSGWYHTCGAVLIGSDKVLCAAHCVDGRQPPVSGADTSPIALPDGSTDFGGMKCTISGWGDTTEGDGVPADTLQYKEVDIYTESQCKGAWAQYDHTMHICLTGSGDAASCQGDSGGPLECMQGGSKVNAGVTSWGVVGCAGLPSVYTRVSNYLDFINQN